MPTAPDPSTGPNASASVVDVARAWSAADPDPHTASVLGTLIDAGDHDALIELFDGRIAFGTAGLRAPLGPGPNRMNRLVVRQTTAGLMHWLLERDPSPLVVIGFDARHGSADFARDTAAVVASRSGPSIGCRSQCRNSRPRKHAVVCRKPRR